MQEEPRAFDEMYFEKISRKLPFLKTLRAQQNALGDNYFWLLIYFFKKFSELSPNLNLDTNPQKRYELLFNIVEMGNLIDAMRLLETCEALEKSNPDAKKCKDFLLTLKRFRNVVADGYHAYSTQTSAEMIPPIRNFFISLGNDYQNASLTKQLKKFNSAMYKFKTRFEKINGPEEVYNYITDGRQEKEKVETLFGGIKYFLDKASDLFHEGQLDCAILYFIAAGNCARDFENYFCEKTRREKGLTTLTPGENIALQEDRQIKTLLIRLKKLRKDRGELFAHKYGEHKGDADRAMFKQISKEQQAREYIDKAYRAIDDYLHKTYGTAPGTIAHGRHIQLRHDSPRAYNSAGLWTRPMPPPGPRPPAQRRLIYDAPPPAFEPRGAVTKRQDPHKRDRREKDYLEGPSPTKRNTPRSNNPK